MQRDAEICGQLGSNLYHYIWYTKASYRHNDTSSYTSKRYTPKAIPVHMLNLYQIQRTKFYTNHNSSVYDNVCGHSVHYNVSHN